MKFIGRFAFQGQKGSFVVIDPYGLPHEMSCLLQILQTVQEKFPFEAY